jgi:hypothetical protein
MEVLGALASTAQIAVYAMQVAVTLCEVYERVKHAPDRIRQHADHIKCLLDIAHHIQEKHSSDSSILLSQLKSIILQACNLRDLIDRAFGQYTHPSFRRRYWKLLKGNKEKRILAALQNLEREKTGLSLCLAASHNEILQDVRREVRMSETDMTDYKSSGQDSATEHDVRPQVPAVQYSRMLMIDEAVFCVYLRLRPGK